MTNGPVVYPATELKPLVEEMIQDPRLVGLAKYIVNINFYWSDSVPTACAGHGFIFFNQKFFYSICEDTRIFVIAHEIEHLALRHLERGKKCNPSVHNQAADHVINLQKKAEGFTWHDIDFELCCDPKYRGMSTEEVYNILIQDPPPPQPGQMSADQIEDLIKSALEGEGQGATLEEQMEKAEKDIKSMEKTIGFQPGSFLINLHKTNKNIIIQGATYQDIFKKYLIDPLGGVKRTFARPNRRQHGRTMSKFKLKGRLKRSGANNRLTHLVYALDVSGSITEKQAQQFHDSVRTLKEMLNPEKLTVLFFDTEIRLEKTFSDLDNYAEIQVCAGGGTCLKGVWRRTKQLDPEALVVFTDMEVTIPREPEWDVIWLVPFMTRKTANYGKMYLIP